MKFTIKLQFEATDSQNAQRTAQVLQKLLEQVPEEKIQQLHDLMQTRPNIVGELLDKLNNPLLKKLFS